VLADAGDVVRTELRLALSYQGWEYTVLKKDSSQSSSSSGGQEIQVMVRATSWNSSNSKVRALSATSAIRAQMRGHGN
jgi:hypothetical protein